MSIRSLAESIILQSLEDLFVEHHRGESLKFFEGEGFALSADMAGLGPAERDKILDIYSGLSHSGRISQASRHRFATGG